MLTNMGQFNAVLYAGEPSDLIQMFDPTEEGEKYGRLDGIEKALSFVNDQLDSDKFYYPQEYEEEIQDLVLRGFYLEQLRFRILREDWEPMFKPFPSAQAVLKYHDPDVRVREDGMHIDLRKVEERGELEDPFSVMLNDFADNENITDVRFSLSGINKKIQGDDLFDVFDEFHDELEEETTEELATEFNKKALKAYREYYMRRDDIPPLSEYEDRMEELPEE